MSEATAGESQKYSRMARYVRFTSEEYHRISEEESRTGKSAQELLKEAYFRKAPTAMLMTNEDRNQLAIQIHKIGTNVNQIAKKLNSGFSFGFEQEIETIRAQLTLLLQWMMAKYRNNKV